MLRADKSAMMLSLDFAGSAICRGYFQRHDVALFSFSSLLRFV